ncbi:MAG TPA: PEP-utilizing enzyme [Caldilineaceae bacterium]|nr:PEP-utilizing enzyme [Caldilineaceae bacterium]
MLFDFTVPGAPPDGAVTIWSQFPLHPLASGPLTPFSYSVLAEVISRGWYLLYDRLGFDPPPRSRLLRRYQGYAYLNLSLSARLEAKQGIEPVIVQVNQRLCPLADWEKPRFLGSFKASRAQRKRDELPAALAQEMEAITQKAAAWSRRTQELRWSQAEVLQVMEEIERVGQEAMSAYLLARHQLAWLYAKLLERMDRLPQGGANGAQKLLLINGALCDLTGLLESEIAQGVIALSDVANRAAAAGASALVAWLKAGDYRDWQTTCPSRPLAEALAAFLARFGHRTMSEGEMARPRWSEDPTMVMRSLLACLERPPKRPARMPVGGYVQRTLDALEPSSRRQGQQMLQRIHELHLLQSRALHALAYVWDGTRRWALAAAKEAMADGRLDAPDEVFFFELEEIKQMMTGEWNISGLAEIRAALAERQATHRESQQLSPAPLLLDDQEAQPARQGLPGVAGLAAGPLRRWASTKKNGCHEAILGAEALDSGWALGLPLANGFVSAGGSPLDSFVAAARVWHHPVVVGLGAQYWALVEGAQTTVDGDAVLVSQ